MRASVRRVIPFLAAFLLQLAVSVVFAQSGGNSGTIYESVTDPSGAVVPGASVTIENPVSHYHGQTTSDGTGKYQFANLPFNPSRSQPQDSQQHRRTWTCVPYFRSRSTRLSRLARD